MPSTKRASTHGGGDNPRSSRKYVRDADEALYSEESNDGADQVEEEAEEEYKCICGGKDLDLWIGCDNPDCHIQWYHAECLGITKVPPGEWLCPLCKPVPSSSSAVEQHGEASRAPKKASLAKGTAKKGVAVKKILTKTPLKPTTNEKPRWKGWVGLSSQDEEAFKQSVESPWQLAVLPDDDKRNRRGTVQHALAAAAAGANHGNTTPPRPSNPSLRSARRQMPRKSKRVLRDEQMTETDGGLKADDEMSETTHTPSDGLTDAEAEGDTVDTRSEDEKTVHGIGPSGLESVSSGDDWETAHSEFEEEQERTPTRALKEDAEMTDAEGETVDSQDDGGESGSESAAEPWVGENTERFEVARYGGGIPPGC